VSERHVDESGHVGQVSPTIAQADASDAVDTQPDWLNELVDAPGETGRGPTPRWVVALEDAFAHLTSTDEAKGLYGDVHHGATLEQAWRTRTLFGSMPVCLVAKGRFSGSTAAIPQVVWLDPEVFITRLAGLVARFSGSGLQAVQLFCLGNRIGHSVVVRGADPDLGGFLYHDPWPKETLLARMGIKPRPANGGGWWVSASDLTGVIQAAFVEQPAWSMFEGREHRVNYGELVSGEFWTFFNLRETERRTIAVTDRGDRPTDGAPTLTQVTVRPDAAPDGIILDFYVDRSGFVESARLLMNASWVSSEDGPNPLAFDLAASFVRALTPVPDAAVASDVSAVFLAVSRLALPELNAASEELRALVGALFGEGEADWPAPAQYSTLAVQTVTTPEHSWRSIVIQACSPTFGFYWPFRSRGDAGGNA
jgi:hypothetical protein